MDLLPSPQLQQPLVTDSAQVSVASTSGRTSKYGRKLNWLSEYHMNSAESLLETVM